MNKEKMNYRMAHWLLRFRKVFNFKLVSFLVLLMAMGSILLISSLQAAHLWEWSAGQICTMRRWQFDKWGRVFDGESL